MHHRQRLADDDRIAQFHQPGQADGEVDRILRTHAATAQRHHGQAQFAGVDRARIAGLQRRHGHDDRRRFQVCVGLVHQVGRAAQGADHACETLGGFARIEGRLQLRARFLLARRQARDDEHLGAQRHRHLVQARRARFAAQVVDRDAHFDGIAGGVAQRFVHAGQDGRGAGAGAVADVDDRFGQFQRFGRGRHEGAAADLHVHHQRIQARRQLLGQDRAGDHGHRFHGRRGVADAVETLVGRRQLGGLADDGHTHVLHHLAEFFRFRHRAVARD